MYTFNRNKSYSRIDYILTSKSIGNEVDSCTIEHFPLSDHDAISIKLVMETETRGPGLWKMNTSILENPEYVKQWTKQKCNFSTLTSWWEIAKIRIKEISIDFCKELNKSKTGIKQLEKTMEQLKQKQLTDDICSEIQLLSEKIKDHYKNQAKAAQIRSRAKFITENEKSTAYFFNLEKIRGKEKLWSKIKTESGETKYEGIDMQAATELLTDKSKSPGIDGIPAEWYQKFWYIIKHDFVELTTEILSTNKLCDTQYKGVLTLIYKNGDRGDLKNWRPLSILCVDYKIIAKALSNRIKPILSKIIHSDQKGFIKNKIPKYYLEGMESWGKFLQTFTAITTDEVLNTPLFGNHIIKFKSKPLFIANFSKSGIKRIKDVWDLTKSDYVSTENLLSKLKSKQNWIAEWTMIKKSIPKAVIDTLKCGVLESTQN
ncbi:YTX2-like protein, partial [Mya arenaria]